jgi:flagellar assembly factor FliW
MTIQTLRFGPIEVPDDKFITMARPILGFEKLTTFCLIEIDDLRPFLWLQSTEDDTVAFLVVNPLLIRPDYRIEINRNEIAELHVNSPDSVETYVIVTIPDNPGEISANMQGPLLVNVETNLAKQLVLVNSQYKIQHRLLDAFDVTPAEQPVELVNA